jgi:CheY-like chemotaxis protein
MILTPLKKGSNMIEITRQDNRQPKLATPNLPILSSQTESTKPPAEDLAATKRILVVDDEEYITWMLQEGLEKIPNWEVLTTTETEQAMQLLENQSFDLLITDYRMPGIDGLGLASSVRQLSPRTAVVMLTAHSEELLRKQAEEISIRYILKKPITLPEIRSIALEVLANIN